MSGCFGRKSCSVAPLPEGWDKEPTVPNKEVNDLADKYLKEAAQNAAKVAQRRESLAIQAKQQQHATQAAIARFDGLKNSRRTTTGGNRAKKQKAEIKPKTKPKPVHKPKPAPIANPTSKPKNKKNIK